MTKVVLLTRAMPSANALVRRLLAEGGLARVIVERLPDPKVKRSIARRAAERIRDPLARARELRARSKIFGSSAYPIAKGEVAIDFIPYKRWDEALPILEREHPDLVCIFGTSLVPEAIAALAKIAAVNLHAGIAPQYRGNNCVAFAIINDDLEHVGATLHLVTPKIDGGPIITSSRALIGADDDETSLVYKVQDLSHRLFVELVTKVRRGEPLDPKPQPEGVGHVYLSSAYTRAHAALVRRLVRDGAITRHVAEARARAR